MIAVPNQWVKVDPGAYTPVAKSVRFERRQAVRQPVRERMLVMWEDDAGRQIVTEAQSIDVSREGMSFKVDRSIAIRTPILLNCPGAGIVGRATVRYCIWAKAGYKIGIHGISASPQPSLK